jgi:hypothetical protein
MIIIIIIHVLPLGLVLAEFGSYVKVNDDSTSYDQVLNSFFTQNAIIDDTVYAVWHDGRMGGDGGDVYFAKGTISPAGDLTWADNIRVSDGTKTVNPTKVSGPDIAVDEDGVIYVVWTYSRQDSPGLYLSRSLDDGESFQPEQLISDRSYPKVAAADGYVYIMCGYNFGGLAVYTSQDSGESFAEPTEVADGAGPSIIAADGDYVYLAKSHSNDIYMTRSSDHGESFGDWMLINDDGANTNLHWEPSISADDGNVYLAWQDRRDPVFSIYMAVSHNHGSSFGSNIKLSPPPSVDYNPYMGLPSVSAYGDHVAVSFVAGNYREIDQSIYKYILVKVSHDAGDTWSDEMVAAYPSPNPPGIGPTSVAINNESVCTVWQADTLYFDDDGTGINVYSSCYRFADIEPDEEQEDDECADVKAELEELQDDYDDLSSEYDDLASDYDALQSDYEDLLDDYDEAVEENEELQSEYDEILEDYEDTVEENEELAETNAELLSRLEEQGGGIPGFPLLSVTISLILVSILLILKEK